mmetsp:Transcript_94633/g.287495  ORF Transcript_94633/g.287495 Transcript_94633/m.287495 type:complete len:211 (-) Transcript_94633:27-659(-)
MQMANGAQSQLLHVTEWQSCWLGAVSLLPFCSHPMSVATTSYFWGLITWSVTTTAQYGSVAAAMSAGGGGLFMALASLGLCACKEWSQDCTVERRLSELHEDRAPLSSPQIFVTILACGLVLSACSAVLIVRRTAFFHIALALLLTVVGSVIMESQVLPRWPHLAAPEVALVSMALQALSVWRVACRDRKIPQYLELDAEPLLAEGHMGS